MKEVLSAFASFAKVFLSSALTLIVSHGDIWSLNYKEVLGAAIVSTLPVVINFLNPNDGRYGIGASK